MDARLAIPLPDGCIHRTSYLDEPQQLELWTLVQEKLGLFATRPGPRSHVQSVDTGYADLFCYGKWWDPGTYRYALEVHAIPDVLKEMADRIAAALWGEVPPWHSVLVNRYRPRQSRLGLHQDRSEHPLVLQSRSPVLTISIGAACIFQLGGFHADDEVQPIVLSSGDVFLLGGPSRLRFDGVRELLDRRPSFLNEQLRISLTFRQVEP